jgi:hypothetical protein
MRKTVATELIMKYLHVYIKLSTYKKARKIKNAGNRNKEEQTK